jgi:secretion/DNA translocation related ATPase
MTAPGLIERVRARLVLVPGAPTRAQVAALVREESGGLLDDGAVLHAVREALDELSGAGPLEPLLRAPDVTDVLVNGPGEVWVDRGSGLERTDLRFADEGAVRRLAVRLAGAAGRRLDDGVPWVDAGLPDGTRLHAVLPPVADAGTCLSLRVLRRCSLTVADLAAAGAFPGDCEYVLRGLVAARAAFLVTGGTGSGKTTLLSALLGLVPTADRLVICEDAPELAPRHPHVVRLVGRPANVEGAGEVTLRDLVRQALRMRPDRVVVGEVRGAEVVDLLAALNTGHEGGAGTLHANRPAEVPARLEALGVAAGMDRAAVHSQAAAGLSAVVHLRRTPGGRRVEEIGVLRRNGSLVTVEPGWRAEGGPVPGAGQLADLLSRIERPC